VIRIASERMRFWTWIAFLLVFFCGCAQVGAPPGGPEDKTAPQIDIVTPVAGSVSVPLDSRVVIKFSEAINSKTVEKAVFITPAQIPEPKIKIKSNAIIISFPQGLEKDKTYVVTLGTDLKDAHNINLAQSISLAFSTGSIIDSGSIKGTVYKQGKGVPGINLALFEQEPSQINSIIDSVVPQYITQTGQGGVFEFRYLPLRHYYLIAFEDQNKNRRINLSREAVGLPSEEIALTNIQPKQDGINIPLHIEDTSQLDIKSLTVNPDCLIKLGLTRKLDMQQTRKLLASLLLRLETDTSVMVPVREYTYLTAYPCSDFLLYTPSLLPRQQYKLTIDVASLYPVKTDSLRFKSYVFSTGEMTDRQRPSILESYPSSKSVNVHPDSLFELRFSERLDSVDIKSAVRVCDSLGDTNSIDLHPVNQFTYQGQTSRKLEYSHKYRLLLEGKYLHDLSGNLLADSTISFEFTTIGRDTLGQISGAIELRHDGDNRFPVVVSFNPVKEGVKQELVLAPGQIRFVSDLMPGYYTISAFLDHGSDSVYNFGKVTPYELSEPFTILSDTVRVRMRFESTGITIKF